MSIHLKIRIYNYSQFGLDQKKRRGTNHIMTYAHKKLPRKIYHIYNLVIVYLWVQTPFEFQELFN